MTVYRIERAPAKYTVCADCLRGAVCIHPDHYRAIKEIGLLGRAIRDEAVLLIAIGLNRLDKTHRRIVEVSKHPIQHIRGGFVVGIEDYGDVPGGLFERVIDVSRLCVLFNRPGDVADAEQLASLSERRIISLVAEVIRVRIPDRFHGQQRPENHSARLPGACGG